PGHRAAERRRVEVRAAGGANVERAALQCRKALARERVLAVDEDGLLGAVGLRLVRHRLDVRLVVLTEVGGERVRDRALLAHPRERTARVEAARERDANALAHRQRAEDHRAVLHARSRWWANVSASSAPVVPSRTA